MMKSTEILQKLTEIFRDEFDDDSLTLKTTTSPEHIEDWDSLAHINLIEATQEEFEIRFSTEELAKLKDVESFIELIEKKV